MSFRPSSAPLCALFSFSLFFFLAFSALYEPRGARFWCGRRKCHGGHCFPDEEDNSDDDEALLHALVVDQARPGPSDPSSLRQFLTALQEVPKEIRFDYFVKFMEKLPAPANDETARVLAVLCRLVVLEIEWVEGSDAALQGFQINEQQQSGLHAIIKIVLGHLERQETARRPSLTFQRS